MDFHLYTRAGGTQCSWVASPVLGKAFNAEPQDIGNSKVLCEEGNLIGMIVGWSDLDLRELWEALHEPGLDRAKSLLASAEGTFAGVFVVRNSIYMVTDVSGSIPIYFGFDEVSTHVASKAEMVARAIGNTALDPIATADFLQNGAVCHPFTLFDAVRAAPPGSISHVENHQVVASYYWTPNEEEFGSDLEQAAFELRETVRSVLSKGLEDAADVTMMFSGGEDARSLVPLLPNPTNCRLRLIANEGSREHLLARSAAGKLGIQLGVVARESDHYRKQFTAKVQWAGAGHDVRHFHVFAGTADLMSQVDAVVGGLGSDKLFKSDYIFNVANKSKQSFLPERLLGTNPDELVKVGSLEQMQWLRPSVADAVWQRHLAHHELLRRFRPVSAGNWHTLWPLGGHSQAHSQFLNNIRYGPRVVEPFLSASTYKLAAVMPDKWKVDRKVFTAAFIPVMGQAAWVPTTAGRLPALNGVKGRLVQFAVKSWRVAYDGWQKTRHPSQYGDQGPWACDHKGFEFNPRDYASESVLEELNQNIDALVKTDLGVDGFWTQQGAPARERRVLAIQVAQVISGK